MRDSCYVLVLFLLLLPLPLGAQSFTGQVVGVEEGDVLEILWETEVVRVQLYGIDTPEIEQPFGREAIHYVSERVLRDTVVVTVKEKEGDNRLSGIVETADGSSLNDDLLREGLAWWHNRKAPDAAHLQTLEQRAQRENRGIWSQYHPIAPWEWRAGRRSGL